MIAGFVVWERSVDHPMLPLAFFRSRRFSVAIVSVALGIFALLGGLFVLTQFLQFDLGYTPLGAGLRMFPIAGVLAVAALASPRLVSLAGTKLVAAAGLALIVAGLAQIGAISSVRTTYLQDLPGMLLIGIGAGLLIPAAIDSVLGAVTQDDAGVGTAANSTAMQVGGAVGVAVVGSVLSTRYQHSMKTVLAGQHVPAVASHTIFGSIGGALAVARKVQGPLGAALARAARVGFMLGNQTALTVGACVTGTGALLVLAALPSRPTPGRRGEPAGAPPARPA